MTFDDDTIRLHFEWGCKDISCKEAGVDWPPPEHLFIMSFKMRRVSFVGISDDIRASSSSLLFRSADYVVAA